MVRKHIAGFGGFSILSPQEMDAKIAEEVIDEAAAMKDVDPMAIIEVGERHFGGTIEVKAPD